MEKSLGARPSEQGPAPPRLVVTSPSPASREPGLFLHSQTLYSMGKAFVSYSEQDAASEKKNLSVVQATCKAQKSRERRRCPSGAARIRTCEAVSCTLAEFSEKTRTLVET